MQSSLGVKTLLQDPALVARSKSFSADPPVKKPRPLSGMEPDAHYNFSFTKLENSELKPQSNKHKSCCTRVADIMSGDKSF